MTCGGKVAVSAGTRLDLRFSVLDDHLELYVVAAVLFHDRRPLLFDRLGDHGGGDVGGGEVAFPAGLDELPEKLLRLPVVPLIDPRIGLPVQA